MNARRAGLLRVTAGWLLLLAHTGAVGAEREGSPSGSAFVLQIEYDRAADRLSIEARHAPLGALLEEVSTRAQFGIRIESPEFWRERVSADLTSLPLEGALRSLLREFNSAFLYAPAEPNASATASRLVGIVISSKKHHAGPGTGGPGAATAPPGGSWTPPTAPRSVEPLAIPARMEGEDFAAFRRGIDRLSGQAPQQVLEPLVGVLLQSADPPLRVYAASTLGDIADPRAIESLTWTFANDEYPLARQVAMYSLLQIGSERALEPIFEAFGHGNVDLQRAIAIAIASRGGDGARERLARILADGDLPEDVIGVWQSALPPTKRDR